LAAFPAIHYKKTTASAAFYYVHKLPSDASVQKKPIAAAAVLFSIAIRAILRPLMLLKNNFTRFPTF
jgi:predicted DsbA family dithiol-disulfide isomerase